MPNIVYAELKVEEGGTVFDPIANLVTYICDSAMQFLQNTFISTDSINMTDGKYEFKYSPAIIFSGEVPAFDINFINPGDNKKGTKKGKAIIAL